MDIDPTNQTVPLLIFFDLETTGLLVSDDHITELAAKVVGVPQSKVSQVSFSRLVRTSRNIPIDVSDMTGITKTMLRNEKTLSEVLPEFLKWVCTTTKEVSEASSTPYHPVLVAHNGYKFDFPILLAEISRRPHQLKIDALVSHNIHFADTLTHLQQSKKDGSSVLATIQKFGLKDLYSNFFPLESYSAHRALADVEALEKLFMETQLVHLLSNLPFRPPGRQIQLWSDQQADYSHKRRY